MIWHKSQEELRRLYSEGKTTVYAYRSIYQIFYSQAQHQYYVQVIRKSDEPYTLKGRIHATKDRI